MHIDFIPSLQQVEPTAWNRLWRGTYPFVRHEFLLALEASGCTTGTTGWQPEHCLAWRDQQLIGAVILYRKTHSYGEYVFDWSWANAYHQAGGQYYPKFVNAIPFTPATGPRWAADPALDHIDQQRIYTALWQAIKGRIDTTQLSGFHCLFPQLNHPPVADTSLVQRLDCQYHWFNQGYTSFQAFLAGFASRKRKNVLRERSKIIDQHLQVEMTEASQLEPADWRHFYQLYRSTYLKRSGHDGYLNEQFFLLIGAKMPENLVVARALQQDRWIAGALYFKDQETLYGRYWGALEEFDGLHFECCYYQGIDYAIQHKLQRFDPGAQGEHKIARGFTPVLTCSQHYLRHPQFAAAVARFLREERQHMRSYCMEARQQLPFNHQFQPVPDDCLIKETV